MGGEFSWKVFDDTFNAGKFRPALHMLLDDAPPEVRQTAVYWQKRAMCHLILGDFSAAEQSLAEQKKRPDWDESQQVAFNRDYVLALIRRSEPLDIRKIQQLLKPMKMSDDVNVRACGLMIRGRASYKMARASHQEGRSNFLASALRFHEMAAELWDTSREEGVVWGRNNDYHHLKARRMATGILRGIDARKELFTLYHRVLNDPNKKRRMMAHLIVWTGRFGLWIEDQLG